MLSTYIQDHNDPVIIDEIQKIPHLLDEVHRLIEDKKLQFILTGSSARKLRRLGVNMLGGRAYTYFMYPLTAAELGEDFTLKHALKFGTLPLAITSESPHRFLQSYVKTYLKEEIQLEGFTRNLAAFSRFLQAASFSQAAPLNISAVAADCSVERKVVEDYFQILRDLLLSIEIPLFKKRAKRELIAKSKFFFFDAGVFRALRPTGPLDAESELNGPALETLILHHLKAMNDYLDWNYEISYWHTRNHEEVDLVLYGPRGFFAIEVKNAARIRPQDFSGLELFHEDYPQAKRFLIYGGTENKIRSGIQIIPAEQFLHEIKDLLTH
ncbi:MAG: ATP-binding protein [Deltaproteobacteria bacterium]|nr:ATP-binding protein [Deltaproteobacteria bacterium]